MPILASRGFTTLFYTNLAFARKTETLGSLYSYVLLIPAAKSKNQVMHEQKFKDLLSSTWQVSVERRVLDFESEVMRGRVLFPLGITFCHWIFSPSKSSDANVGIIANFV